MDVIALIAIGLSSGALLFMLYFAARKAGLVDDVIVAEFPFRMPQNEIRVKVNLAFHLLNACFFTLLYTTSWSLIALEQRPDFPAIAILTGLVHGVAVAIGLIIYFSGRRDGLRQAVLVITAHIVFALSTALGASLMQSHLGTMERIAQVLNVGVRG